MLAPLRLVMMGTGPFAAPTFRALYRDSARGGVAGDAAGASRAGPQGAAGKPVAADRHVSMALPIYDPESINTDEARAELVRYRPELLIVADYGQILSPETLAVAPLGGINLHGSLLPKYRGAAPINWAIYHGERETGVTVIHMTPRIDAGPCLAQAATPIDPDETAVELETRLAELGRAAGRAQRSTICRPAALTPIPQDKSQATRAPRLKKTDGQIDWSRPAAAIKNQVRALEPWPKTYTLLAAARRRADAADPRPRRRDR